MKWTVRNGRTEIATIDAKDSLEAQQKLNDYPCGCVAINAVGGRVTAGTIQDGAGRNRNHSGLRQGL